MQRQISLLLVVATASLGLASCVDQSASAPAPSGAQRLGLDSSISCPEGEVGWRFAASLDPDSEEYARRAGDSAVVQITNRYAVDVQSVTCDGQDSSEANPLRNQCGGSLTCDYSSSCSGSFVVTYTCGAADTNDAGSQKEYTATASGGVVHLECSQPAKKAIAVETHTACVPRQCHGRARRNLDMQCVENPDALDVVVDGDFDTYYRLDSDRYGYVEFPYIQPVYPPQTPHNINVLQGAPLDRELNPVTAVGRFGNGLPIYPRVPYTINLRMNFYYGIIPPRSTVVAWIDDQYQNKDTGEFVKGFRCVAFKKDIVHDGDITVTNDGTPTTIPVEYYGVIAEACTDGRDVSEDNAAKTLGLSTAEFRQQYEYYNSELRASYDLEGRTAWHKHNFNVNNLDAQYLAYDTPQCTPNPQDFFYDASTGTYDLIGYYSQREFAKPVEINFVGPEIGRQATIIPGKIAARSNLTIRVKSKFNATLPIDLSWTAVNLNDENWFNPWAKGVDIGGAWQDGKSLPQANFAPTNVHASVFVYPYGQTDPSKNLYQFKIGEIALTEPNPEGKTESVNLPITGKMKRYFTRQASKAYIDGDTRLFTLWYCIESDEAPKHPQSAFKTRIGAYYWSYNGQTRVGQLQQNYLVAPYQADQADHTVYSLKLDSVYAAKHAYQPFSRPNGSGRIMRGCRADPTPLRVNIDRFVTPMEPISNTGFTGSTKTSESGDQKMSGSNDNDAQIDCTGPAKDNCEQVNNGGNRTDGESGRSTFDLNSSLSRKPGDHVSAGMTAEMLGFQLVDPTDPVSDSVSYPADSASASSTPVKMTLAPDWDGIKQAIERANTGSATKWETGRYGGQMGLGVGWGYKYRWLLGPVPVEVAFTFTVGASVAVEAQVQFGPTDAQKYPCIGSDSCVEKVSQPATFREAAKYCNVRGGRLAELSSQAEANAVDNNQGSDDIWVGAQLAYRFPKPACATNFNTGECMSGSQTEYRWLSNSAAFAHNGGTAPPTYDDANIFNAFHSGLATRYPNDSAVVYKSDGTLAATNVNVQKPFLCTYDPAAKESFLRWQLALKMGAAAGFNLTGCVPSDNPGFCLGAGFNVVSLSIGPQYEDISHKLYHAGEDTPFGRRGTTNISVPWALKLFEGRVYAAVNVMWFSLSWDIVYYSGITAAEGKLYDADTPVIENY